MLACGVLTETRKTYRSPRPRLYLESRYCKLERGLPQTVFYCPECKGDRKRAKSCTRCEGYGKLTKDSVQEILSRRLLPALKARFGKFHGAGREDLDVLMLGRGRPFVFEAVGSRNPDLDLEQFLQGFHERNGERVQFAPFRLVDRARVAYWKEAKFAKIYRAIVQIDSALDPDMLESLAGRKITIIQRTPQRVAHRRADLERERNVELRSVKSLAPDRLEIEMCCSHGSYVKEWISGDDGRTKPSLGELIGCGARCIQLDVLDILDQEEGD